MKRTAKIRVVAAALMLFGCAVFAEDVPEGFVKVPGGTIVGKKNEKNYDGVFTQGRTVTLSPFYIAKYEVTREEYEEVMAEQKATVNGTEYKLNASPSEFTGQENLPVERVTWYDAVYYCIARSIKEGLAPAYYIEVTEVNNYGRILGATVVRANGANGYRLPTEAEWEYAARGGDPKAADWDYTFSGADTESRRNWDSDANSGLDAVGWYLYNGNKETHPVGQKKPNRLGIYDMSGNVWEWCYDWDGDIAAGNVTNPIGALSGDKRIVLGGSWYNNADREATCRRTADPPSNRLGYVGFRVVRSAAE